MNEISKLPGSERIREFQSSLTPLSRSGQWIALALCAMVITQLVAGSLRSPEGMKIWVPCLFYGSWFLWAIVAGVATRSYQLRSASSVDVLANVTDS